MEKWKRIIVILAISVATLFVIFCKILPFMQLKKIENDTRQLAIRICHNLIQEGYLTENDCKGFDSAGNIIRYYFPLQSELAMVEAGMRDYELYASKNSENDECNNLRMLEYHVIRGIGLGNENVRFWFCEAKLINIYIIDN